MDAAQTLNLSCMFQNSYSTRPDFEKARWTVRELSQEPPAYCAGVILLHELFLPFCTFPACMCIKWLNTEEEDFGLHLSAAEPSAISAAVPEPNATGCCSSASMAALANATSLPSRACSQDLLADQNPLSVTSSTCFPLRSKRFQASCTSVQGVASCQRSCLREHAVGI